jgi:hypothetical protein
MAVSPNTISTPEIPPASPRELLERAVEGLIAFLDALDPDPDLEDGADAELVCEDEGAQCDDEGDTSTDACIENCEDTPYFWWGESESSAAARKEALKTLNVVLKRLDRKEASKPPMTVEHDGETYRFEPVS